MKKSDFIAAVAVALFACIFLAVAFAACGPMGGMHAQ